MSFNVYDTVSSVQTQALTLFFSGGVSSEHGKLEDYHITLTGYSLMSHEHKMPM